MLGRKPQSAMDSDEAYLKEKHATFYLEDAIAQSVTLCAMRHRHQLGVAQ